MAHSTAVIAAAIDPALAAGVAGVLLLLIGMFVLAGLALWVGQRRQVKKTVEAFGLSKPADVGADSDWWSEAGAAAAETETVVPPWMENVVPESKASSAPIYVGDTPAVKPAASDDEVDWSAPPPPAASPAPVTPPAPAPKLYPTPAPLDLPAAAPSPVTAPAAASAPVATPPAATPAPAPAPAAAQPAAERPRAPRAVPSTFGAPPAKKTDS